MQSDERIDRHQRDSAADGRRSHEPTVAEEVGEAAGGISGAVTGAAIGSIAGPIGLLIGGIAGAVGGWWAGREIADMAEELALDDDAYYRGHYDSAKTLADRRYEDVRPVYQLGQLAGLNPDYTGRDFNEIEPDLRSGWTTASARRGSDWESVRSYAREGYQRGRDISSNPKHPLWQRRRIDPATAERKDNLLGAADRIARRFEEVTGTPIDVLPEATPSVNVSTVRTSGVADRLSEPPAVVNETPAPKEA